MDQRRSEVTSLSRTLRANSEPRVRSTKTNKKNSIAKGLVMIKGK